MTTTDTGHFEAASVPEGYRQHLQPVIFEPWAERLIDFVGVSEGQAVVDVASGTGVVARLAASKVGPGGRVIASDISPAMLAHVEIGLDPEGAVVETLECSATELDLPDASVDVVLCQQGFPFIPERVQAAAEMRRVLQPGGVAGAAVWLTGTRLEPFQTYADVLEAAGVPSPFPHGYSTEPFAMTPEEMEAACVAGGLSDVAVETSEMELGWASPEAAAAAVMGTPHGPTISPLSTEQQAEIHAALVAAMTGDDGRVNHVQHVVMARGVA